MSDELNLLSSWDDGWLSTEPKPVAYYELLCSCCKKIIQRSKTPYFEIAREHVCERLNLVRHEVEQG